MSPVLCLRSPNNVVRRPDHSQVAPLILPPLLCSCCSSPFFTNRLKPNAPRMMPSMFSVDDHSLSINSLNQEFIKPFSTPLGFTILWSHQFAVSSCHCTNYELESITSLRIYWLNVCILCMAITASTHHILLISISLFHHKTIRETRQNYFEIEQLLESVEEQVVDKKIGVLWGEDTNCKGR